jgi:FtsZ-interacting cell division protein ZipA
MEEAGMAVATGVLTNMLTEKIQPHKDTADDHGKQLEKIHESQKQMQQQQMELLRQKQVLQEQVKMQKQQAENQSQKLTYIIIFIVLMFMGGGFMAFILFQNN